MGYALTRHIRELASVRNGLSMAEELTLLVLADKDAMTAVRLFGSYMSQEARPFMGDTSFWKLKTNPAERWVGGVSIDPQETLNWRFDEDRGIVCRQ